MKKQSDQRRSVKKYSDRYLKKLYQIFDVSLIELSKFGLFCGNVRL